ncbi:MAG: Uma2 family endonuclease [Bacteroidetes bacterium]|nr:Uma2 family endonuclease [Bacteroidota bacterium]
MSVTLEAIMQEPAAPLLIERAQLALKDETRRRQEFREWVTEGVKAEFINGAVVLHSPVKRRHRLASDLLFRLVSVFADIWKVGEAAHEKAMISLTRNDYEPDICFWSSDKTADFDDDTMLHPAPDFIVEILSKKTQKHDRTTKFKDYAFHGVREYWIIDPNKKIVEQYLLPIGAKEYEEIGKFDETRRISSFAIPRFEIPVAAIFDNEANLAALLEMAKGRK